MLLALEPIEESDPRSAEARACGVHIRDKAWLLSVLEAGQVSTQTAADAELVQKTQQPAGTGKCNIKPKQHAARAHGPVELRVPVPGPQAARCNLVGSLIADSQEGWQGSQDIIGEQLHTAADTTDALPDVQRSHAQPVGLQDAAVAGLSATAAGPAAGIQEVEWIGSPQGPPPDCGLQATEMRRFYGAFRKVTNPQPGSRQVSA